MTPEQLELGKAIEAEIERLKKYLHPLEMCLDTYSEKENKNHATAELKVHWLTERSWDNYVFDPFEDDCPEFLKRQMEEDFKSLMIHTCETVKIRIKELELEMMKL